MVDIHHKLVKLVDRMPAFPKSVHHILQLTSDLNFRPKELIHIIDHDPVLTMKILRLVNSSYFGFPRRIMSNNQAAVFLGINTVKNLAISVVTSGIVSQNKQDWLNMNDFLLHALATATITKRLGLQLGVSEVNATDYFVAGLLHDFGKVVFFQFLPQEFNTALRLANSQKIALYLAEREIIGADHAEMGAMLGEKWQLPASLVACIREHHNLEISALPADTDTMMLDCVRVANNIAKHLNFGQSGSPVLDAIEKITQWRFNLALVEMIASLHNLEYDIDKSTIFSQL